MVASETGLSDLRVLDAFPDREVIVVTAAPNSVNFFKDFEVREIICKPRRPRYTWPINQKDWKGDREKYRRFVQA